MGTPFGFRLGGSFLLATMAALSLGQGDLRADSAFIANGEGRPATASVGEPFYVGVNVTVTGRIRDSYRFRIETPYGKFDSPRLSYGVNAPGSYWVCWGPVPSLIDGPIEVRATLDPERRVSESNENNNSASITVNATPPATPIEAFDRRTLWGRYGLDVSWTRTSATPSSVTFWVPVPASTDFQRVGSAPTDLIQLVSERFGQPIGVRTLTPGNRDALRQEATTATLAFSSRINRNRLIELGRSWAPDMEEWLQPEALVEVNRREIRSWASSVLARVSPAASTVERAEALYRSILERCSYTYRPGLSASALTMARTRRGDCGGLSSLFVALCRASEIPARAVGGFSLGTNQWHVWAEFYVAGGGWVPVDPAFAENRLPAGSGYPIYFGVIPELNERMATMVGFDRAAGGRSLPMLQSPAVFWEGNGVRLGQATPYCELTLP